MKIPTTKSRPSATVPYARPQKQPARSAGDVKSGRSRLRTRPAPLDFSGVKKGQTAELSTTATSDKQCGFSTPPSLRRASTLPLTEEDQSEDTEKPAKDPSRLSRKSSSGVGDGVLVSSLRKLESGSIVGNTCLKSSTNDKVSSEKQSISETFLAPVSGMLKTLAAKCRAYIRKPVHVETRSVDENCLPTALKELKLLMSKKSDKEQAPSVDLDSNTDDTGKQSMDIDIKSKGKSETFEPNKIQVLRKRSTKENRSVAKINSTENTGNADENVSLVSKEASKSSMGSKRHSSRLIRNDTIVHNDACDVNVPNVHAAILPPAGLVEVAISFDTTGSMYDCLDELRLRIQDLIQRLQADIPGIRIAVIAHGDYCDTSSYVIKWLDFGASLPELCDFVESVEETSGGDDAECYELVLLRARDSLSWTPGSRRVLIMTNDDVPHEPGYTYMGDVYNIDWREECAKLRDMGVTVYGVQSEDDKESAKFNAEMARITGGKHLALQDFSSIFDFIMMICYREGNPDMLPIYEKEVRARDFGGLAKDVEVLASTFGKDEIRSNAESTTKTSTSRTMVSKTSTSRTLASKTSTSRTLTTKTSTSKTFASKISTIRKTTLTTADKHDHLRKTKPKTAKAKHRKPLRKRPLKGETVLKRERLPDSYFSKGKLKSYTWTRWTRAIIPELSNTKEKLKFAKCSNYPGFRLKSIFNGDSQKPAIYEFAVQAPGCPARKKHVVYFRKTIGYKTMRFWDLYQLRHGTIQKEVERAVTQGCSIWIRRGVLKGRHSVKSQEEHVMKAGLHIKTTIDYAWKKYLWRKIDNRMFHRVVTIKGKGTGRISISFGDL